jgi:hypothetical protein
MPEGLAVDDGCAAPMPGCGVFELRRLAPDAALPARVLPACCHAASPRAYGSGKSMNRKKERKSA